MIADACTYLRDNEYSLRSLATQSDELNESQVVPQNVVCRRVADVLGRERNIDCDVAHGPDDDGGCRAKWS